MLTYILVCKAYIGHGIKMNRIFLRQSKIVGVAYKTISKQNDPS